MVNLNLINENNSVWFLFDIKNKNIIFFISKISREVYLIDCIKNIKHLNIKHLDKKNNQIEKLKELLEEEVFIYIYFRINNFNLHRSLNYLINSDLIYNLSESSNSKIFDKSKIIFDGYEKLHPKKQKKFDEVISLNFLKKLEVILIN